jgi:soluble lytic murein transglycosylase-like protein
VQREILLSVDDGEAANRGGCLSILLWPPFSSVLFGALLLFGLTRITVTDTVIQIDEISPIFTAQVLHWQNEIVIWADEHQLDPNLVATVMQIESCGDPHALSPAGAMGLFQVMPYHFAHGEDPYNPETNSLRGLNYLKDSVEIYGDIGLALAGYNGGIQGAHRPQSEWAQETIDYKYWGEGIYRDAITDSKQSQALEEWLAAGGVSLCAQAEQTAAIR